MQATSASLSAAAAQLAANPLGEGSNRHTAISKHGSAAAAHSKAVVWLPCCPCLSCVGPAVFKGVKVLVDLVVAFSSHWSVLRQQKVSGELPAVHFFTHPTVLCCAVLCRYLT
jgi:hypothetical protein